MVESELPKEAGAEASVFPEPFSKVGEGVKDSFFPLIIYYFLSLVFCKMSTSRSCENNNSQYLPSTFLA